LDNGTATIETGGTDAGALGSLLGHALLALRSSQPKLVEHYLTQAHELVATRCVPTEHRGLAPWQMRRVKAFVEQNATFDLSVARAAALVDRSPSYFCRAFRAACGRTFHQFVLDVRLARARDLMLTTQRSLADIAAECGLSDQAHLCRVWRRAYGSSPARWRRAVTPGRVAVD
jgi:AraC-like DNA-binding protein